MFCNVAINFCLYNFFSLGLSSYEFKNVDDREHIVNGVSANRVQKTSKKSTQKNQRTTIQATGCLSRGGGEISPKNKRLGRTSLIAQKVNHQTKKQRQTN